MGEYECCKECRVETPQKYFGCEYPCDKYRKENDAKTLPRLKKMTIEYEDCIIPCDSDDC